MPVPHGNPSPPCALAAVLCANADDPLPGHLQLRHEYLQVRLDLLNLTSPSDLAADDRRRRNRRSTIAPPL